MAKRTNNFTSFEIERLLDLVDAHKHILENKKTDRVTSEEKKRIWTKIAHDFNAEFSECFRTEKVLMTKYQNLKRAAKSNFAFERQQSYKTGGGSKSRNVISHEDNRIMQICQAEQLEGLESHYDDDKQDMTQETFESIIEEIVCVEGSEPTESTAQEVEKDTPKEEDVVTEKESWARLLKKAPHKKLTNKTVNKSLMDEFLKKKIEKVNMEMKYLQEKQEIEMEILRINLKEAQRRNNELC